MARKTMGDIEHYVNSYNHNKHESQPYVAVRRENDGISVYWMDGNGDIIENFLCNLRTGEAYQIVRALANSWYFQIRMDRTN